MQNKIVKASDNYWEKGLFVTQIFGDKINTVLSSMVAKKKYHKKFTNKNQIENLTPFYHRKFGD